MFPSPKMRRLPVVFQHCYDYTKKRPLATGLEAARTYSCRDRHEGRGGRNNAASVKRHKEELSRGISC